jgi:hypothetical protein
MGQFSTQIWGANGSVLDAIYHAEFNSTSPKLEKILEWILIGRNLLLWASITPMIFTKPEPNEKN